jgi:hypothetical protein
MLYGYDRGRFLRIAEPRKRRFSLARDERKISLIGYPELPVPKTSFAVLIPREFNTKPDNSNYSLS